MLQRIRRQYIVADWVRDAPILASTRVARAVTQFLRECASA